MSTSTSSNNRTIIAVALLILLVILIAVGIGMVINLQSSSDALRDVVLTRAYRAGETAIYQSHLTQQARP